MSDAMQDWLLGQTWRYGITEALERHGETWESVEYLTWSGSDPYGGGTFEKSATLDEFLDRQGHGYSEPFTLWTATRVYFPARYDSSQWVESVPRNPCDQATEHVGGG